MPAYIGLPRGGSYRNPLIHSAAEGGGVLYFGPEVARIVLLADEISFIQGIHCNLKIELLKYIQFGK